MSTISGTNAKAWGLAEATFDTVLATAATDAFDFASLDFSPDKSLEELQSHIGNGSFQGEIDGGTGGKWSAAVDIAPGSVGVAPDVGFMLKAGFGDETIVGATSVTYDFNDTAPQSLQLTRVSGSTFCEVINGAWVESITIEGAKGGIPRYSFAGGFASFGFLYGSVTVSGTQATGATAIVLTTNHGYQVRPGVYVVFGADTNSGAGYKVTAVTASGMTITPGIAGAGVSTLTAVTPLDLSQTLTGTRIGGVSHGLAIDGGSAIGLISAKYAISTGIKALDKESSSAKATALMRAATRTVDVELEAYFKHENLGYFGGAHFTSQVLRSIVTRFGPATAAARLTVTTPKTLIKVAEVKLQDNEISTIKIAGRARQSAAAADEITALLS